MSSLKSQCRVRLRDYWASRQRIRRGSARKRDEEIFEMRTGKSASSVKKESSTQRACRLEKERVRNAKRVRNESDEERHRRKEADRIRHQIRRSCYYPRNQTVSVHDREILQEKLRKLCRYPKGYSSGWYSSLTKQAREKRERRLRESSHAHILNKQMTK